MTRRKCTWDEYIHENKARLFQARFDRLSQSPENDRRIRNRPRDAEKQQLLMDLDAKRWQRMLASGELEQTGQRRWVWH